jgi:ketosteroid isomerase-like protein
MVHAREEVQATVDRYVDVRRRIDQGELGWDALAQFFTDDAVYIDPAWGRIQGLDEVSAFFVDSMKGLEDWTFPVEYAAIEGDTVVVKWWQITPGERPGGEPYVQSGISTLHYAGDGKFDYEEDLLNMVHVLDDLRQSGWRPGEGFQPPPPDPVRDFSRPGGPAPGWP